jgi:hypothetical protein
MTRSFTFALVLSCICSGLTAQAQTIYPITPQPATCPPPSRHIYPPIDYPYSGYWGHASTVAEGLLNGQANMLRGLGAYNLYTSQAMVQRELARQLAIQNRQESLKAYFEGRELNASYRRDQRQPAARNPVTTPAAKPALGDAAVIWDPQTGAVAWPSALQTAAFNSQRCQVESLVHSSNSENSDELRTLAAAMKQQLKRQVRDLAPMAYVAANKFLSALPAAQPVNAAPVALAAN